jgi:hypothetical protein
MSRPRELLFVDPAVTIRNATLGNVRPGGEAIMLDGARELRLWSCHTGSGKAGLALVEKLALAAGAGICGGAKLVGASALGETRESRARRVAPQPPLTGRGVGSYAGLLAGVRRIISGDVPQDPAENVTYVVVDSRDKQVVATFTLPGRANIPKFSITVTVPSATEIYEAGRLDERGKFIPAKFTISESSQINVGVAAGEARHGR